MADWNGFTTSTNYATVVTNLNDRLASCAKMDFSADTNIATNFIRYSSNKLQRYNGSTWDDVISAGTFDHNSLLNYDANKHPDRTGTVTVSGAWTFSTAPKLSNAIPLKGRNAANSADIDLLVLDSSDNTIVKSGSGKPLLLSPAGIEALRVAANQVTYNGVMDLTTGTSDGSDNASVGLNSAGVRSAARGGYAAVYGNEHASKAGQVLIETGSISGALMDLKVASSNGTFDFTINGTRKMRISSSAYTLDGLTASRPLELDASKNIVSNTAATFKTNHSIASSGANSDITGLTGIATSSWTPTVTCSGSMTNSANVVNQCLYQRIGGWYMIIIDMNFTLGGTASNQIFFSFPQTISADGAGVSLICGGEQNGAGLAGTGRWRATSSNRIIFFKEGNGNFTLGANAGCHIIGYVRP